MSTPAKPQSVADWINPPSPDAEPEPEPEPGYHEWLAKEIEEAIKELEAGKGIPIEEIRKEFGLH